MANTLTGLIPVLYKAVDKVSRELTGFIPSVGLDLADTGAAVGQTIRIPVTNATTSSNITPGATAPDNGDQTIGSVDVSITKSKYVPIRWNGEEAAGVGARYDEIRANQFAQAMRVLVNEVEQDLAGLYYAASRAYGSDNDSFKSDLSDPANLRKILADNGAPMTDLQLVISTAQGARLRTLAQLTKANEAGTDDLLRRGVLLDIHGFAVRESAKVATVTQGAATGYVIDGAHVAGSVGLTVKTGAAAINKGAIITIANDSNKYVVAADYAGGAGTLYINAPGLKKAAADTAAISVATAAYDAALAFDRGAIQLVARPPLMPQGGDAADDVMNITDPVSGLTFQVALYRQYRQLKYEIALAWGVKAIKPEHIAVLIK